MTEPTSYVDALPVAALFADPTYQRDRDLKRCRRMADELDRRLLGVLEVSDRGEGRYAILDGQHRHGAVELAEPTAYMVCQIYSGLSVEAEAQLFHELNARRKALSFWDRWKSRRASGDKRVAAIERTLDRHGLQVHPAPADGNVGATAALEIIVDQLGDVHLLDSVLALLIAAFGRSRDAFAGGLMQGLALVLLAYDRDELDLDRLIAQLSEVPVRQMKARASGMREMHSGTYPRLFAGVIVEQYNRGPGRKLESFFTRLPERAVPKRAAAKRTAASESHPAAGAPANGSPHKPGSVGDATRTDGGDEAPTPTGHPSQPAPPTTGATSDSPPSVPTTGPTTAAATRLPPSAAMAVCACGHTQRRHEDREGICLVGDGACGCSAYRPATG